MSDINLLPDELRKEESKEMERKRGAEPASVFHLPESEKESAGKEAVFSDKVKWETAPGAEEIKNQPVKTGQREPSQTWQQPKKKSGLFSWFFKKKERGSLIKDIAKTDLPKEESSVAPKEESSVAALPNSKSVKAKKSPGFWSWLFKKKPKGVVLMEKIEPVKPGQPLSPAVKISAVKAANQRTFQQPAEPSAKAEPFLNRGKEIDVNLLPEGITLISLKKLLIYFTLAGGIGIIFVVFVYSWLVIYDKNLEVKVQQQETQFLALEQQIKQQEENKKEIIKWGDKIEGLTGLLERHIYWSKFFPALEKVTMPDIYYNSINVTDDGSVALKASAPNFTALARQYLVLEDSREYFPVMEISGIAGNDLGVTFEVKLTLNPNLYYSLAENDKKSN